MITLEQAASKFRSGLSGAAAAYQMGVDSIREHPGVKAAANLAGYLAGVQASQNKWLRNVQRMPLETLKQRMKTKGASNLTSSAQLATEDWQRAMQTWYPIIQSTQASIKQMSNTSRGDRKARMNEWFDRMAAAADAQLSSV